MKKKLIHYLSQFVLEDRLNIIQKIAAQRTNYITLVLENIFQAQNASAVLRTADCFGLQDVHVIENFNTFDVDTEVAMGASKWLNIHKYNKLEHNSLEAIQTLRKQGFRIIATTPHANDITLDEFDLHRGKAAFFFGTELTGLTDVVLDNADEFVKIPMYGFTESFNISVCAALVTHHLTEKLRKSDIQWQLTDEQYDDLLLKWLRKSIKKVNLIEKRFSQENS